MSAKAFTIPVQLQLAHTVDRPLPEVFHFVVTERVGNYPREAASPSHVNRLGRHVAAAQEMLIQENLTWKFR
jgi:hypothetical protein